MGRMGVNHTKKYILRNVKIEYLLLLICKDVNMLNDVKYSDTNQWANGQEILIVKLHNYSSACTSKFY